MGESNNWCRLCFNPNREIINMFDENGVELNIAEIVSKHFWFKVNENDEFSNVICTQCWCHTENFHKFYCNIEISYNAFIERFNKKSNNDESKSTIDDNMVQRNTIEFNNIDTHFIKVEVELSNEDINNIKDNFIDESKKNKNTIQKVVNIENEKTIITPDIHSVFLDNDINDFHHSTDDDDDNDDVKDEDYTETISTRNSKIKVNKSVKRKIKIKKNINLPAKRKYTKRSTKKKETVNNDDADDVDDADEDDYEDNIDDTITKVSKLKTLNSEEKKLNTEKEDAQIREYFKMVCDICECKFQTYLEAKMHYRKEHKINGYISCCGRKFSRRGLVLDHILHHLNPEFYKCEICGKKYADKSTLKYHIQTHTNVLDKPHKCDLCPRTFLKTFQLSQHQKLRHANKRFTCDDCGKSFPSKPNLTTHINYVHKFAYAQICDICAKVFKSKQVLKNHRELHFVTEVKPRLQCNICGSWLKHELSLRKHIARHQDIAHKCPDCGKIKPNYGALRSHIRSVHTGRVHVCNLCNKGFKQAIVLREHIASHTGESLYTCPHCPKTFNSSANMHSHRKKIHPEEWVANRGKRVI